MREVSVCGIPRRQSPDREKSREKCILFFIRDPQFFPRDVSGKYQEGRKDLKNKNKKERTLPKYETRGERSGKYMGSDLSVHGKRGGCNP